MSGLNDRTQYFLRHKERVLRLLKNWADKLSGASQGILELGAGAPGHGPNSPLNSVAIKRMGKNREAQAYEELDKALARLKDEYPHFYRAIEGFYLTGDVGEHEYDRTRLRAQHGNPVCAETVRWHDEGVKWLTLWLIDKPLHVKWPDHTRYIAARDKMYNQVERVYASFRAEGKKKTEAVEDVIDYYDGAIGRSTVWKVVASGEQLGRLPKKLTKKSKTKG